MKFCTNQPEVPFLLSKQCNETKFYLYNLFTELKIYHLSLFHKHEAFGMPILAVCRMVLICEPGEWLSSPIVLVAQWLECPAGVWGVMVANTVGDSDFFFVPCSWQWKFYTYQNNVRCSKWQRMGELECLAIQSHLNVICQA